jgi:hypothetical protein
VPTAREVCSPPVVREVLFMFVLCVCACVVSVCLECVRVFVCVCASVHTCVRGNCAGIGGLDVAGVVGSTHALCGLSD